MCTRCTFSADRIKSKWGVDLPKKNKIRTFAAENQIPNKKMDDYYAEREY